MTDPTPSDRTFLTTPPHTHGQPCIYYLNSENKLYRLDPDGKPHLEKNQKPHIQPCSPLANLDLFFLPIARFPSERHVLGKNVQSEIRSIIPGDSQSINIEAVENTKIAAFQAGVDDGGVHYERKERGLHVLVGSRIPEGKEYLVADNIAPTQPIAATAAENGFRPKYSLDAHKAKYPGAEVPIQGHTRYTVYHGDDDYLWLSIVFELSGDVIETYREQISCLPPNAIFNHHGERSPLALLTGPGRLIVYFLNQLGNICRISLHYEGGWGKAVELCPPVPPRQGTNLAGSREIINTMLHVTVHIAYQDDQGKIRSFPDTFEFNDPK